MTAHTAGHHPTVTPVLVDTPVSQAMAADTNPMLSRQVASTTDHPDKDSPCCLGTMTD